MRENNVPEIWETEEEKGLSMRKLKNNNFLWALQNFRGKSFINKSINKEISISRDGLGKWKSTTRSRDQALSIKILGKILEIAEFWKERSHIPPDPNIEKVVYFKQHCKINGNDYTAVITIKVYRLQNRHKYYHHYLDDFVVESKK